MRLRFIFFGIAGLLGVFVFPWQIIPCWNLYYITQKSSLEQLVREIAAEKNIDSIDVGVVDTYIDDKGQKKRFDSYRFINNDAVTEFAAQVTKKLPQPIREVQDYCVKHAISYTGYAAIHRRMQRLGMSGFSRGEDGVLRFSIQQTRLFAFPGDSASFVLSYVPEITHVKQPSLLGSNIRTHWFLNDGKGL